MAFLLEKEFRIAFASGVVLHLIIVFRYVEILNFKCRTTCSDLLSFDIPASLFYFAFPDGLVIVLSSVLGSILWGFEFYVLLRIVRFIVRSMR
ncbi:MAG: hypothetical protein HY042_11150 [Spirochaetia bacterium]|nr:hypothetical protein [Spirochaetia bacterium]